MFCKTKPSSVSSVLFVIEIIKSLKQEHCFSSGFAHAGQKVKLSLAAEEVALFFAQMLDHEYTTKKVFRENFFKDWREVRNRNCTVFQ